MIDEQDFPSVRVLVVGGAGHYGRHIVHSLVQRGTAMRVLSQNVASARSLLGEAPEIVEGDITTEAARRAALRGCASRVRSVHGAGGRRLHRLRTGYTLRARGQRP